MPDLKQSTAATITVHLINDDGTVATGKTIANGDVTLSKEGGAEVARSSQTAVAEDANGRYQITLDTADTDTVGELEVVIDNADIVARSKSYNVLAENAFDSKRGVAIPDVNVAQIDGDSVAATKQRRILTLIPIGNVVADAGNSTTQFKCDLTATVTGRYADRQVYFLDGVLDDEEVGILTYDGSTKIITCTAATSVPADGQEFVII